MLNNIIQNLVENPSEENKESYFNFVNKTEYSLLVESESLPKKSQEYFTKRSEAFSYRRNSAIAFMNMWVGKYGSTKNSPVTYADTLNIPFQSIKIPSNV